MPRLQAVQVRLCSDPLEIMLASVWIAVVLLTRGAHGADFDMF